MRYVRYMETKFMFCHALTLPHLAALRYPSARYNTYNYTKFQFHALHR
ncbi:MAG: hypothetical protein K0Q55_705, partial [Verrucomicrobia bacterium]|nr:hypothetical protein [Verrucomicrobiota bacterium]